VIDLHLHTTASDGHWAPADVAARVHAAGLSTFAITDHDTVAWLGVARGAAAGLGLALVDGIEVTAVADGRDVHVLGYWFDPGAPSLLAFLVEQRARRVARVERMSAALARAGAPIDVRPVLDDAEARPGAAVGRPALARALVAAGHASSVQDAFDRLLGEGRPGHVPRTGVPPEEAIAILRDAGAVTAIAHPGVTQRDDRLPRWAAAGADALEAFHPDHGQAETARYLEAASALDLAVSGGSDYHGDGPAANRSGRRLIGGVTLPAAHFARLQARRGARHA
jgi:predicted metal-dependent phosphoesterase TrpH